MLIERLKYLRSPRAWENVRIKRGEKVIVVSPSSSAFVFSRPTISLIHSWKTENSWPGFFNSAKDSCDSLMVHEVLAGNWRKFYGIDVYLLDAQLY